MLYNSALSIGDSQPIAGGLAALDLIAQVEVIAEGTADDVALAGLLLDAEMLDHIDGTLRQTKLE
jgi:hypothetical protein